jgi:WXG100 family type VII secretion target
VGGDRVPPDEDSEELSTVTTPISVRVEDLKRAHGDFADAVSTSKRQLNEMQSQISTLGVAWTGSAATAFAQSLQQWGEEFQNIIRQLDGMRGRLEEVGQKYNVTSDTTTQLASGAAIKGLGI